MRDFDPKHYIDTHLPGTLNAIVELAERQLAEHNIGCSSVAGLTTDNGAFSRVMIRMRAHILQQDIVCGWVTRHGFKIELVRYDARAEDFVLFVIPAVPVIEGAKRRNN